MGIELSAVSYKEKIVSMLGGWFSICLLVWITGLTVDSNGAVFVVASMGASAVLLFAVPHGQLSQPWPVLAGHVISATIGVLCAHYVGKDWLAAGFAVGISIGSMHQLKCIHPPGGATAFTAVLGGEAVYELGFYFIWWPVLVNAIILVGLATFFNWPFKWRRYPAFLSRRQYFPKSAQYEKDNSHDAIVGALRKLDSFIDVTEDDLMALARMIAREQEAQLSSKGIKQK